MSIVDKRCEGASMIDPTAQFDADERLEAEQARKDGRCMRCGGMTIKQNVLNNCHRHNDDCIAHLRLALRQSQALCEAAVRGKTSAEHRVAEIALRRSQIEAEIVALDPFAKDYDTDRQSNDTCLAAGAHDALRWALGLAEQSISEVLKSS